MPATPYPQLRSRPQTLATSLDDLVAETRAGRVRIPDFQRGLKWQSSDAIKLLDSIDRGYPIGTLLFWQRASEAERVRLGPREFTSPARPDAWFVIDGQQRLTALMRTLDAVPDDPWRAAYDLDQRAFVALGRSKPTARRVPVEIVFDQVRLLEWQSTEGAETSDADRRELFELTKRLQKYKLPMVVVEASSDEEDAIRDIFSRLNEMGKRLDVDDAFRAFQERPRDRTRNLDSVVEEVSMLGFGKPERDLLVKLLATTRGIDPGKVNEAISDQSFLDVDALPTLTRALQGAIQFLQVDCAIPHRSLVPYDLVFHPLVRFFQLYPTPHPRTRVLLRRYVWRGSVHRQFRADLGNTRTQLEAVQVAEDEHEAVQHLLKQVSATHAEPEPAKAFGLQYATPKMETIALLALEPRDWLDGSPLWTRDRPLDASLLPPSIAAAGLEEHGIWSRVFRGRSKNLTVDIAACRDDAVLRSHGLDEHARECLATAQIADFVSARRAVFAPLRAAFYARMAEWTPPDRDRPPLSVVGNRARAAAVGGRK